MKRVNTLARIRVLHRIQAQEDRAAWEDAKWERVAAFLLDFVGGSALGIAFGLAVFVYALSRVVVV
jgi:uncharacterized RDD family membrane protein YckC